MQHLCLNFCVAAAELPILHLLLQFTVNSKCMKFFSRIATLCCSTKCKAGHAASPGFIRLEQHSISSHEYLGKRAACTCVGWMASILLCMHSSSAGEWTVPEAAPRGLCTTKNYYIPLSSRLLAPHEDRRWTQDAEGRRLLIAGRTAHGRERDRGHSPSGGAMEYERALFRVYDKSMEGFHSRGVRSTCNLLQKLFLVASAGLFAALVLLHHQFVNKPGMHGYVFRPQGSTTAVM